MIIDHHHSWGLWYDIPFNWDVINYDPLLTVGSWGRFMSLGIPHQPFMLCFFLSVQIHIPMRRLNHLDHGDFISPQLFLAVINRIFLTTFGLGEVTKSPSVLWNFFIETRHNSIPQPHQLEPRAVAPDGAHWDEKATWRHCRRAKMILGYIWWQ